MQNNCIFHINIQHPCGALSVAQTEACIMQAAQAVANDLNHAQPWACSLVVADNAVVQRLNQQFRQQDKPTNVLSFPAEDIEEDGRIYVGDIIIAADVIDAEAAAQGKALEYHLQHMAVHGILHLMGYDHQTPEQAQEMESLEIKILQQLEIPNPYV